MNSLDSPDLAALSLAAVRQIDEVCDRFEEALLAGRQPRLEEFLATVEPTWQPTLLRQLLLLEWEYGQKRHGGFDLADYLARFAQHETLIREAREQHAAETATESASLPRIGPLTAPLADAGTERDRLPTTEPSSHDWEARGYVIVSELGRGGMGAVYLACQKAADRLVALKVLQEGLQADPLALDRFRREAVTLARLQHPHIVPVYEVDEHKGRLFYTMEYCSGGSLAEHLRGVPLPPFEAATLLETLARAVHAAHLAGVIHRDLKPGNILLVNDGLVGGELRESLGPTTHHTLLTTHQVKLADFGLAKKLDAAPQTQTGAVLGTPQYMAPEQARGESNAVGAAADIYALGAILYECLTGRPPFLGVTPLDTLRQVIADEPVPPARLQPKTPRDLETICLKCLRKEPPARYASANQLADDLRRFVEGRPILARPLGPLARTWRWCRRNQVVAGLLALVMVVLLGGLAGTTFMWRQAQHDFERAEKLQGESQANWLQSEKNFDKTVAAVEEYYSRVSENQLLFQPAMAPLRKELMTAARPYFEQFVEQRRHDPRLRYQLAKALRTLADIETTTGSLQKSWPLWEEARTRLTELHRDEPDNLPYRAALAACLKRYSEALARSGQGKKAQQTVAEAIEHFQMLSSKHPMQFQFASGECECCQHLAELVAMGRERAQALEWMRKGLTRLKDSPARNPVEPWHQTQLAHAHTRLGSLLDDFGQAAKARPELEAAKEILTPLANHSFAGQVIARHNLARTLGVLGLVYAKVNQPGDAENTLLEAEKHFEQLVREAPTVKDYRLHRTVNENNLGLFFLGQKKFADAESWLLSALKGCQQLHEDFPRDHHIALELAATYRRQATQAQRRNNPEQRLRWNREAAKLLRELVKVDPSPRVRDLLAKSVGTCGQLLIEQKKFGEALPDLDQAVSHASGAVLEELRADRALCRAKTGNWKGAADDCAAAPAGVFEFKLAQACALCHDLAADEAALTESQRKAQAESFAIQALQRLARLRGSSQDRNEALRKQLQSDPDFSRLRQRKDFQFFIDSL